MVVAARALLSALSLGAAVVVPPRRGLTPTIIIDSAQAIADKAGLDGLTLHGLAAALKVRSPSLYNHVAGLDGIREALHLRGLQGLQMASSSATAGKTGPAALNALAASARDYARAHPGLYAAAQPSTDPSIETSADLQRAGAELLAVWTRVVGGFGLTGDDVVHAVRAFRSATHGFIQLELAGVFGHPVDAEESFRVLIWTLGQGFSILADE
jgi:AcrR family transcriptional regulator